MSELKPCPFCGKTARLDYSVKPNGKHWFITCDRCGMMYQDVISQRKYVKDGWNTRPIEDALNARIAELEAERRWIPVSERLPEDRATILAAFKNREILTATYYKHYEAFGGVENWWDIEGWHSGNVTHWMPLPESPEESER